MDMNNIKRSILKLFLREREYTTLSAILILKRVKYVPDICILA
jgi:hypothetical protein